MITDKEILFEPFPKQEEFINAALSGDYSFITYGGAIRGGKTYALLALFIILSRFFPGSRWAIVRKDMPTIKQNLIPSWNKIKPTNFIAAYNQSTQIVTFKNGSQIIFFPESHDTDKDYDRWRGLEVNGFGFEEINECQEATLFKAFERAGSYILPMVLSKDGVWNKANQPKPIIVATCNPTQGWFKKLVYEQQKINALRPGWLYIQSRIFDNLPLLEQQPDYLPNLKTNLNHYEYAVFVEGDWDIQLKSGNEFLHAFDLEKHLSLAEVETSLPFHISLDNNVYPYIAISIWQIIKSVDGWIIREVDELPVKPPGNNASVAANAIIKWLNNHNNKERVYLYGDYSTKNTNTIDITCRSFFQIIEEQIKSAKYYTSDKMLPHASPSSIADFINAIFNSEIPGLSIEICEHCKESINDYIETKRDKNGNIDKVVQAATDRTPSYQKSGHFTDTFKDFIVQAFNLEYKSFLNKHSNIKPGGITQPARTAARKITF